MGEKIKNSNELEFVVFCMATLYWNMKCCIPRAGNRTEKTLSLLHFEGSETL